MGKKSIPASQFKARCLAILDEVKETKIPLIVTKRGKPVVKLVPVDGGEDQVSLLGSVSYKSESDLIDPVSEAWEADS